MILYYILLLSLPLPDHPFFAATFGGITVEKMLGLVCFVYALFYLVRRKGVPRILGTAQARSFLIFFVWASISFFTLSKERSNPFANDFTMYLSHFFLLITTLIVVDSLYRLRWTLLAVIASIGWTGQYALREWRFGNSMYGSQYRAGWIAGGPDVFTASALIGLAITYYFLKSTKNRWERRLCYGCLFLGLMAIMVAASRGGFVGLVVTLLFILYRSRQRARNLIIAGFALTILLAVLPSSPLHRILHPSRSDAESTHLHMLVWQAGLRMLRAHPITGVGLGNFKQVVRSYADPSLSESLIAHDTYIQMAAELGMPGLLAYLAIIFFAFRSLERTRRRARKVGQDLIYQAANGLEAGLAGFCVSQLFVTAVFMKLFWFAVFISACLPPLLAQSQKRQESAAKETELYALVDSSAPLESNGEVAWRD